MVIAQISDPHVVAAGGLVYGRFDTGALLARCVDAMLRLARQPEVVLATGDLVNGPAPGEYERLRALLAPLPMPVYLIPGNHDERAELCAAFPDHPYLPPPGDTVRYAVEDYPLRLLALDTVVPGATGGALDGAQLDWLEARLAEAPRRPTLIFMHHPPFRTGIPRMDEIGLAPESAGRLGEIVQRHRQIERIVCGHVHRAIETRWGGTTVSICPSATFQYSLRLDPGPLVPADNEPPAFQLHCWNGTELVTHTVPVARDP